MRNITEEIMTIARRQQGTLLSSDVDTHGIARIYITRMVEEGTLQRIGRGVYILADTLEDEMLVLQKKYRKLIFSHETALFLHGYSDRVPFVHSITVPSGYKVTPPLAEQSKVYYIQAKYHSMGLTKGRSTLGNTISMYDIERSLCDLLRSRNRIDIQVFSDALKRIAAKGSLDTMRLFEYARKLNVDTLLQTYMEVLT